MLKNVKCARCVRCGKEYEAVPNLTNCSCGGILDIVYDYDYIKAHLTKETLKNRVNPTMWRYRELLPVEEIRRINFPVKSRKPVKLVYFETYSSKEEAMRREWEIKQLSRTEKWKLIKAK